jgi:hypothetical protein
MKKTATREVRNAKRVAAVFGLVYLAWLLLAMEGWRLPGARWLGVHTPLWIAWLIVSFVPLSLAALFTLRALRRRGMTIPPWAMMVTLLSFLGPTLVAGIYLEYRLNAGIKYWMCIVLLAIIVAQGVLKLVRPAGQERSRR